MDNMETAATTLLHKKDTILLEGNLGLLCNQTSFSFIHRKYLFSLLAERGNLKRVFIPEHGLFGELQDQVPLDATAFYEDLAPGVTFVSLYQRDKERSLKIKAALLRDLDGIIIDLREVGSRYYTYLTTTQYLFDVLKENNLTPQVYVLDHPNPAGRQVEGTPMPTEFASFIGLAGLPHRYGLTFGELCRFFRDCSGGQFPLEIIPFGADERIFPIPPSPNIPDVETCQLYSGQCLFEGTTLSEGRGTTKPFQLIGAPFIRWDQLDKIIKTMSLLTAPVPESIKGVILRPLCFIPVFHKWQNEMCTGFQLHLTGKPFHALLYTLVLMRSFLENLPGVMFWRPGVYEYGNDKPAIELLTGDDQLLEFINGHSSLIVVLEYLIQAELSWIQKADSYRLYESNLKRISFDNTYGEAP